MKNPEVLFKDLPIDARFRWYDEKDEYIFIKKGESEARFEKGDRYYPVSKSEAECSVYPVDPLPAMVKAAEASNQDLLELHCPECNIKRVFVATEPDEHMCEACGTFYIPSSGMFAESDPNTNDAHVYVESKCEVITLPFTKAAGYKAQILIAKTAKGQFKFSTRHQKTFGNMAAGSSLPSAFDTPYDNRLAAICKALLDIESDIRKKLIEGDSLIKEGDNIKRMETALEDLQACREIILQVKKESCSTCRNNTDEEIAVGQKAARGRNAYECTTCGRRYYFAKPQNRKGLSALLGKKSNNLAALMETRKTENANMVEVLFYQLPLGATFRFIKTDPDDYEYIKTADNCCRRVGPGGLSRAVEKKDQSRVVYTRQLHLTEILEEEKTPPAPAPKKESYPGAKHAPGTFHKIINKFPPHKRFIKLFLGSGGILKQKRPAAKNIGVEIDQTVVDNFSYPAGTKVVVADVFQWIKDNWNLLTPDTLVYLDPPYPPDSRRSQVELYNYNLTQEQHKELLDLLKACPAMVAISTYKSELYARELTGWTLYTFNAQTHQGPQVEHLYMNYPDPVKLHEYTYLGKDRTDRQRIKRKIEGHVKKLKALPALERAAIIEALTKKPKQHERMYQLRRHGA